MTTPQILSVTILAATLVLFVWEKLRYDVVALLALLASFVCGIVPASKAFSGFSDQIVIVMASALVVSRAVSRSGSVERFLEPILPRLTSTNRQAGVLVGTVTVLSAFMKNIGALAMFMPIALQLARRTRTSPSRMMMPLAFGSLLGGIMTLIGTSPNIIVSRMREEMTGEPFAMFDFFPVGAGIALAGVVFLTFGWRLLPERRPSTASAESQFTVRDYLTEVRFLPDSPLIGGTVGDLEAMLGGEATVATIIRDKGRRYIPGEHWRLLDDDIMVLEADPQNLPKLLSDARLEITSEIPEGGETWEEMTLIEAVVTPQSPLAGFTVEEFQLRSRYGVNLMAIGRAGRNFITRLRQMVLQVGDVMVLQGPRHSMLSVLANLRCLPLAYRNLAFDQPNRLDLSLPILGIAMALVAFEVVPVNVGFFGAAVILVLTRHITIQEAYEAIDWPIVIMLAALIPVSDAIQSTGTSEIIASGLAALAGRMPAAGTVTMMLLATMLITPFLNNAATVLVMAPIAMSLAHKLGLNPDILLMAVALGAACDFLTPIGHQCNTLVMGPGGYKFGDYWKLGLPLSLIVLVIGSGLLLLVWPLMA